MTHKTTGGRRIGTTALARVEGEGALHVVIDGDNVEDVQLQIYEPPRFFEGFLRGRAHTEPPDITARICGICPVAYQMSACAAIEDACGVTLPRPLTDLRRILYCGEWIESHTLHVHLLHAPDFFDVASGIELAQNHRFEVERGLELKKIGNHLIDVVGGRAVHPINVKVGGFYRAPTRRDLGQLRDQLERARDLAADVVRWVANFDFPDLELTHELVSSSDGEHYPMLGRRVVSDAGVDIAPSEFPSTFEETHVPHSTAKHAHRVGGGSYLVGPLARFAVHSSLLSPVAAEVAQEVGLVAPERNPFRSIIVRAVEVLHACDTALELVDAYEEPDEPSIACAPVAGVGHGVTEAPRGLLYHRYELDESGTIVAADIVPPTSQNQPTIELEVRRYVADNIDLADDDLRAGAEVAIRNHDPCISCATHFLDLTVERR